LFAKIPDQQVNHLMPNLVTKRDSMAIDLIFWIKLTSEKKKKKKSWLITPWLKSHHIFPHIIKG